MRNTIVGRRAIDTDPAHNWGNFFKSERYSNGIFSIEKLYSFIVLSIIFNMPCRRRGAWANLSHRVLIVFYWSLLSPSCPQPIQHRHLHNCSLNHCRNCHAIAQSSAISIHLKVRVMIRNGFFVCRYSKRASA